MLKTKEKGIFDIPNSNKLQITINCKFSLIYNSFSQHEDSTDQRHCSTGNIKAPISAEKHDRQIMSSSFEINKYHVTDNDEKVN